MRGAFVIAAVAALLSGAGCGNACQQICSRMADYAADDCGVTVSPAEIDACEQRQGEALEEGEKQACRDYGDPDVIRANLTCEELERYWSPDAA